MASPVRDSMRGHPIAAFYLLLLLLTWPVMIVAPDSDLTTVVLALLGPSVCALVITGITGGRDAVLAMLRRLLLWRAPGWAWFYAAAGNGLLVVGAAAAAVHLWGDRGLDWQIVPLMVTVATNLMLLVVAVGLTEELGWRGLALPRLQQRAGPVAASLVVGMLWAVWHYPLFIARDEGLSLGLLWFTVGVISASFAYTWLHNRSGGSLLLVMVLHAGENAWTGHAFTELFGDQHELAFTARQLAAVAIAVVLVIATKGALGRRTRPRYTTFAGRN